LTRVAIDLGFIHRPLFAALLWAGLSFNLQPALSAGIFFELLWLDLFPAGTYIPPQALFSLAATLTILACLPDADMRTTVLVVITTLPLAYLGAWIEQIYRKRQNAGYNQLLIWNRKGNTGIFAPHRLTARALVEFFLLNFFLFWLCLVPLLIGLKAVRPWIAGGPQPTWTMLWIAACAGAILALRVRKAYALAVVSLLLGVLASL
jgi:PTS system mannose-specific IIC component